MNEIKLQWGLQPDKPCSVAWGARAIWSPGSIIDLLWDRQSMESAPDVEAGSADDKARRLLLQKWLNEHGLKAMRAICEAERLRGDEYRLMTIEEDGFRLIANPNQSCGYLYLCGMIITD